MTWGEEMEKISQAAALGQKGGQVKGGRKAEASRENGKVGGRPPKNVRISDGQSILADIKIGGTPVNLTGSSGTVKVLKRGEWSLTTPEGVEITFKMG
jgi:hypothetical protein